MPTNEQKIIILNNIVDLLEIPESSYERATKRYNDLGEWFGRDESLVEKYEPHIFPQGSFRLGTAIRPLNEDEAYDLDLVCKLQKGITKSQFTQKELKKLVGKELESYRVTRGIKAPLEEKHRCWRLDYQDDLNFYMDIIPCIPADEAKRNTIFKSLMKAVDSISVASSLSQLTVFITDNRNPDYDQISENWNISNPEGYAKWFEYQMAKFSQRLQFEKAQVDDVPLFKRKSPLQRSIQLLKRHRDQMFKDSMDCKPISIIITTLAARAYNGESDIQSALDVILSKMENLINYFPPKVPNPVDPEEDFADRWNMSKYKYLNLEKNFLLWLRQAKIDFENITSITDSKFISELADMKFSVKLNGADLEKRLGINPAPSSIVIPSKKYSICEPAKPWGK